MWSIIDEHFPIYWRTSNIEIHLLTIGWCVKCVLFKILGMWITKIIELTSCWLTDHPETELTFFSDVWVVDSQFHQKCEAWEMNHLTSYQFIFISEINLPLTVGWRVMMQNFTNTIMKGDIWRTSKLQQLITNSETNLPTLWWHVRCPWFTISGICSIKND